MPSRPDPHRHPADPRRPDLGAAFGDGVVSEFRGARDPRSIAPSRRASPARGSSLPPASSGPVPDAPTVPWSRRYVRRLRATDAAVIAAAIAIAYATRLLLDPVVRSSPTILVSYAATSAFVLVVWWLALAFYRSRDARALGFGTTEYKRLVRSSIATFGALAMVFLVAHVDVVRGYFAIALPLGMLGLLASRWSWRRWLIARRPDDAWSSRALVVGTRESIEYTARQIAATPESSYRVVGAALDDAATGAIVVDGDPLPVVSGFDRIAEAARYFRADAVIVAGEPRDDAAAFVRELSWQLEGAAAELVLASRLVDVAGPRIHFRPVEGLPLIHVEIPRFEGAKHVTKRAFDIVLSLLGLALLSPLMLVVAALVRLEDHGPAIFSQERVGLDGTRFRMLKFRTMVPDAESALEALRLSSDGNGVLFKMRHDPRVTRIGAVLRRFSLDELPQLANVLAGHMSLVGPRPPLVSEVEDYAEHVHRRFYIKPGLTGMWQINGRSDLSWDESVRLDLYYVENWSLVGDLVILWRTLRVLLKPDGAY